MQHLIVVNAVKRQGFKTFLRRHCVSKVEDFLEIMLGKINF